MITNTFYFDDGTFIIIDYSTPGDFRYKEYNLKLKSNLIHRLDGPAIISKNKNKIDNHYWIYGHRLGLNLSSKQFEELKNKKLKELVFT